MKFFIYSRKSVFTGKGESIENQIEMCRQYILTKFPDAAERDITVYEDEGFSAKNIQRPQFQQMLKDLRVDKPDYVVCYRLDRVSRSVSDFSLLIEELNRRGISFICMKEEFDTSKPMGKAMMYIASVFAQLERETIAERVRDNMLMLARTGRWLGGTTPTGYTSEKHVELFLDGKRKISCKLKENPEELRVVDKIFDSYLELHSLSGVCNRLTAHGIKTRSGSPYSPSGVKEILQNPVYCTADEAAFDFFTARHADVCFERKGGKGCGLLAYNKRDYTKKQAPRRPIDKWIVAAGLHRGRIPGRQWVSVQQILESNRPAVHTPPSVHSRYSLLSGLIVCGECGSRMFAKHRSLPSEDHTEGFDYVCSLKLHGGKSRCCGQNICGQQADSMLWDSLINEVKGDAGIVPLLEKVKRSLSKAEAVDPLEKIQSDRKRCGTEMDRLIRTLALQAPGSTLARRIEGRLHELEQELSKLDKAHQQLKENRWPDSCGPAKFSETLSSLGNLSAELTLPEKQAFVRLVVRKILWKEGTFTVFFNC